MEEEKKEGFIAASEPDWLGGGARLSTPGIGVILEFHVPFTGLVGGARVAQ